MSQRLTWCYAVAHHTFLLSKSSKVIRTNSAISGNPPRILRSQSNRISVTPYGSQYGVYTSHTRKRPAVSFSKRGRSMVLARKPPPDACELLPSMASLPENVSSNSV